ncbi:MAG: HlyC/CorC family transporter [Clostridiaceae bacterium]|jgi:putative hemolysin|nr:HlyC/CorC family transporter [Clostridiaceae bacterium]
MDTMLIAAVVFLVVGSAFFSSAEIAYNSASRHKLRAKAEAGDKKALRAQEINERYTETLSTVLVGNNLVNIATTAVVTTLALGFSPKKGQMYAELITTVILLIFGEIIPKILAAEYCNWLVLVYSGPLKFFVGLFKPVVWLVTKGVDALSRLWTPAEIEPAMTDEELVMVVESIQDEGVITESESELIKSVIEFSDITAHEIMIPRVDMVAFDVDASAEELLANEEISHYTRIPLYKGNLDHIVGIVNVNQLLKQAIGAENGVMKDLSSLMREPKFVHMTKNISDMLREMREERCNMAIVLDGFGGTMGLVTMEDILEEIVGDIFDETDEVESDVTEMSENEFLLDGNMNIYDAFEAVEYEPREFESEYTTLGGWITEMLDRFPEAGDSFTYDRLTVAVLAMDERRVDQVRITVEPESEDKGK